jgi:hypothetical protein
VMVFRMDVVSGRRWVIGLLIMRPCGEDALGRLVDEGEDEDEDEGKGEDEDEDEGEDEDEDEGEDEELEED